jgi:hypothetical protein
MPVILKLKICFNLSQIQKRPGGKKTSFQAIPRLVSLFSSPLTSAQDGYKNQPKIFFAPPRSQKTKVCSKIISRAKKRLVVKTASSQAISQPVLLLSCPFPQLRIVKNIFKTVWF